MSIGVHTQSEWFNAYISQTHTHRQPDTHTHTCDRFGINVLRKQYFLDCKGMLGTCPLTSHSPVYKHKQTN